VEGRLSEPASGNAIALIPDALWKKGPRAVNPEIRRLFEHNQDIGIPDSSELPKQALNAACFVVEVDGTIGTCPPTASDRLANTLIVDDLYQETRQKIIELRYRGMNMLGESLGQN
jgi:hypothetical protein